MAYSLRCPDCREKFPWDPKVAWPRFCPQCKADINNDRADDDVVMPFLRSAKTTSADKLYRDMEKGSEVRAEHAAAMAGVSVEDMSSLKITNLNSATREGDIAAPPVNNPVSQFMEANPNVAGFRGGQGMEYSGAVQTGPAPNAGAKMRSVLHQVHGQTSGGAAVSDRPALETTQPGYRRRG